MTSSGGQAVKVCWVIKGYGSHHCPFPARHMSTAAHMHYLFISRIGFLCPVVLRSIMDQGPGTLVCWLTYPQAIEIRSLLMFCLYSKLLGYILNIILLSRIPHLIFLLKSRSSLSLHSTFGFSTVLFFLNPPSTLIIVTQSNMYG